MNDWVTADPTIRVCVVELESVSYMDSTGLGVLIAVNRQLRERFAGANPCPLRRVTTNHRVIRVMNIIGLVKIFDLFKSREEALAQPIS